MDDNELGSISNRETFLSRNFPTRSIHQCIEESKAYEFWENFCLSTIKQLSTNSVSKKTHDKSHLLEEVIKKLERDQVDADDMGCDYIQEYTDNSDTKTDFSTFVDIQQEINNRPVPIESIHQKLKNRRMPLWVKTQSGKKLTLYVYNMVMVMKLKESHASDLVIDAFHKHLGIKNEMEENEESGLYQDNSRDCSIKEREEDEEMGVESKEYIESDSPHNQTTPSQMYGHYISDIPKDDLEYYNCNPLLGYIRQEKLKFYSHLNYMRYGLKHPHFQKKDSIDRDTARLLEENRRKEYNKLPRFRLNLQQLAQATHQYASRYNQRKFASVGCRSILFPLTINIFPHGNVSSTGSTHEFASILSFQFILNILRDIYGPTAFEDPYIRLNNLVLSGKTGCTICTYLLVKKYPDYCHIIDDFSGISFVNRARTDKSHILIFRPEGKLCYSGAKDIESVIQHMNILAPMLEDCMATPENLEIEKNCMSSFTTTRIKSADSANTSVISVKKRNRNETETKRIASESSKKRVKVNQ